MVQRQSCPVCPKFHRVLPGSRLRSWPGRGPEAAGLRELARVTRLSPWGLHGETQPRCARPAVATPAEPAPGAPSSPRAASHAVASSDGRNLGTCSAGQNRCVWGPGLAPGAADAAPTAGLANGRQGGKDPGVGAHHPAERRAGWAGEGPVAGRGRQQARRVGVGVGRGERSIPHPRGPCQAPHAPPRCPRGTGAQRGEGAAGGRAQTPRSQAGTSFKDPWEGAQRSPPSHRV